MLKMRGSSKRRRGTVRMRAKGRASEMIETFTAHSAARQMIWMPVNRCMRQVLTRLTKGTSGWYLDGLNRSKILSKSWMPLRDVTPM